MGQVQEGGEAQLRRLVAERGAGLGQRRQFGVGGGDHDHLGRGLAEIDGLRGVGGLSGLGEEEVHGLLWLPRIRCGASRGSAPAIEVPGRARNIDGCGVAGVHHPSRFSMNTLCGCAW